MKYCDGTSNGEKFLGRWSKVDGDTEWRFGVNTSVRYLTIEDVFAIAAKLNEITTEHKPKEGGK